MNFKLSLLLNSINLSRFLSRIYEKKLLLYMDQSLNVSDDGIMKFISYNLYYFMTLKCLRIIHSKKKL